MTPTALLRYVNRKHEYDTGQILIPSGKPVIGWRIETVLQQWWESPDILETSHKTDARGQPYVSYKPKGEWRDVPIEDER